MDTGKGTTELETRIARFLADLDSMLVVEEATKEDLARALAQCHYLRGDLSLVIDYLEHKILSLTREHRFNVHGVGEVEIKKTTKRTQWDHDRLIAAIVSRSIDEPGMLWDQATGEQLPPAAVGHNIAARLRECVSMGAGKLTGLRAIGLDADEFCVTEIGAKSVKLPTTRRPQ